jgi:tetratricopeptide (TPR) repeat protein
MRLAAATLVPLLLLGTLELGLRITGYGYPTSFFLKSRIDGQDFLIPNYKFSYRFFPPALARVPVLFRMAADKPEGTYRVFLFGESAAFGDPDPSFGVGRYLEALLDARYPATDFEVICVAMTAINSHAVLPIARECAGHDGDLWVIYMGNNEMVGPYGAGTVFGTKAPPRGLVRALLALKTTRDGQLMDDLIRGLRKDATIPDTWAGIDMFSKNPLRFDDPGRLRAYENFRGNLEDILRTGIDADVPILLSTVASNLKDCSPFASLHAAGLSSAQLKDWEASYQAGMALEAAGSPEAALNAYSNAAAIDAGFAELQFRIGSCHWALTNREAALQALAQARDHDALAVRADSRINSILVEAAMRHGSERVFPVDAVGTLARDSSEGIPGKELFYEHVHYTLEGNYRLARVFAEAIAPLLSPSIVAQGAESWAEAEACNRRLAATVWDENRLWREQIQRLSVPPFTTQSSHLQNTQYCQLRVQEVLARIKPETPAQDRQVYEAALAQAPEDCLLRGNYAQFLEATGSRAEAITQGQRVCTLLPDLSWPYYYLGALLVREGRAREAADCFEKALAIRSDFTQARTELHRIQVSLPFALEVGR